jgi:polysaccharide chain length determinant protein (PEP-CTERM system associated)
VDSLGLVVQQHLRTAWRRRWTGMFVAWLICSLGWTGTCLVPNQYESSARLYVDADAILTPLLRGLAADSAPTSQLDMLQRTLLSRPNLQKLISKTTLDLAVAGPADRERLLHRLASDIVVKTQTKNLFTIAYRDRSPRMAQEVVKTLLTIFVESATGANRADMENARRFLEHQISSYEQQLRAAEKRRAEFRTKYVDILPPEMNPDKPYTSAVETARAAMREIEGKLQDESNKRDALRQELANTPPMLVVEPGGPANAKGPPNLPGKSKLREAEEQLRAMLLRDTEQHPDVIAQKRLIEALRSSPDGRAPSAPAADTGRPGDPRRSVPNPVYDQLKVKLVDADAAASSLQRQREETARLLDRLEKAQREQPGLLAEYQNMDRDYSVLRKDYEELLGRLQSANLAQAADTQADKVKLQIIDPPDVPRLPASPNRTLLLSAVLFAGLAGGTAFTVLLGQLDRSFSTVEQLRELGLPVLGAISVLGQPPPMQRLTSMVRFSAAVLALIGVFGGLMLHSLRAAALI